MSNKKITQLIVGSIETNCWIYQYGENKAAVIDPGDEAGKIISVIKKLDLTPEYILLTHGHFDHIAAVPDLAAAFPQAAIAIHSLDSEYLGVDAYKAHSLSLKAAMGSTAFLDMLWNDMPHPAVLLEEGGKIGPFTVLHIPGHTCGSAAFWDKEAGVLFTGDTLFRGDYGRTDLPGGNEGQIFESLRRLFTMDAGIKVYPGHGEATAIGIEAAQNR